MELGFRDRARTLVALVDCTGDPHRLRSGRLGWYEVAVADWVLGWKIRAECSTTLAGTAGGEQASMDGCFRASSETSYGEFSVQDRRVEIDLPLPDCISRFRKSAGWGCASGANIRMGNASLRCQFRIRMEPPGDGSYLEREGDLLNIRAPGGQVLSERRNTAPNLRELLGALRAVVRNGDS